jgi:hypothetical protein
MGGGNDPHFDVSRILETWKFPTSPNHDRDFRYPDPVFLKPEHELRPRTRFFRPRARLTIPKHDSRILYPFALILEHVLFVGPIISKSSMTHDHDRGISPFPPLSQKRKIQ